MPDLNKTNRAVCDADMRDKKTKEPILFFNSANLTTQNISSDSSFAKSKSFILIIPCNFLFFPNT